MHPDVARFVSEVSYEGRLHSAPDCARQGTAFGTGIRFIPVEHEGNRQSSHEEADAIAAEIERMTGGDYTDLNGRTRPLRHDDFMVVAPYNAQVRCLRAALPASVPVGTVDKFQGQEAAVVFFSMARAGVERRRRAAEPRVPVLAESFERGDLARAVPSGAGREPAPARDPLPNRRADAARERALPARGTG